MKMYKNETGFVTTCIHANGFEGIIGYNPSTDTFSCEYGKGNLEEGVQFIKDNIVDLVNNAISNCLEEWEEVKAEIEDLNFKTMLWTMRSQSELEFLLTVAWAMVKKGEIEEENFVDNIFC